MRAIHNAKVMSSVAKIDVKIIVIELIVRLIISVKREIASSPVHQILIVILKMNVFKEDALIDVQEYYAKLERNV